jgi:hypothetical protein
MPRSANEGRAAAARFCLSRGDDHLLGRELAADETRARPSATVGFRPLPADRQSCPDRARVGRNAATAIAGARGTIEPVLGRTAWIRKRFRSILEAISSSLQIVSYFLPPLHRADGSG